MGFLFIKASHNQFNSKIAIKKFQLKFISEWLYSRGRKRKCWLFLLFFLFFNEIWFRFSIIKNMIFDISHYSLRINSMEITWKFESENFLIRFHQIKLKTEELFIPINMRNIFRLYNSFGLKRNYLLYNENIEGRSRTYFISCCPKTCRFWIFL